ncbi:NAD-dependent epimerase/dehydratase family protein [Sulfobacillus thermosulfidooxidans]|uniref:NAD-dependent epimerase/dehydratase family protein n=1 Tax=Sulfobacillus thermosulfidooxidans TaxID=28034 RepID=UPI0006B495DA|nr:NAD-dependent epimerase/dehydratase family protein [Sulfobacillus thermosulfidooxidans]
MHLLITGGAGFIGSHLCEKALDYGHRVTVVDNLSQGLRENIPQAAGFVYGDILQPEVWLDKIGPVDVVIHLAAQISVPASEIDPLTDLRLNLEGTLRMLMAAKALGATQFRTASSAAVYGDVLHLPLQEDGPVHPISFYGWSKYTAEQYVFHFAEMHGLDAVVFRLANVYGPRQRTQGEGGVVAVFCEGMAQNRVLEIHGDGQQTRDFIYVGDVARAFLHRLENPGPKTVYNVSTETRTSVYDLFLALAKIAGKPQDGYHLAPMRLGDIHDSVLSQEKARAWGFVPKTSLEEGLEQTWQYFLNRELKP